MSEPASAGSVVCIGESMILFVPEEGSLEHDERFLASVAGAESNVACGLAHLGVDSVWFSRVGADPFGERLVRFVADRGVDAGAVLRDPDHPTGVFFKHREHGGTRVYYYRAGSAAAHLSAADVARLPAGNVGIVHVTGVSLGVPPTLAATVGRVIRERPLGPALVSFDVNYRPGLWTAADAARPLAEAAQAADLVLVGQDEAETLWGAGTPERVRALVDRPAHLVVKDGARGATHFGPHGTTFEPSMRATVVEAVGAGDAFAAGFLAGLSQGESSAVCLRLGHVMAALTLQDSVDLPALPPAAELWSLARDRERFLATEVTPDLLASGIPRQG
ncbi:MAG TPA: sugar kinase [Propionibacteriaceae bacterium]|nr:sugar kinase [Propionibacteriaceae bacterium]